MRFLGFQITRSLTIPQPPTKYCSCDGLKHFWMSVAIARDILLVIFLYHQIYQR